MKKVTKLLAILIVFCSLFTLVACEEYHSIEEEDYHVGYCEERNDAFLKTYYWRGHLGEDMDIFLPNTYDGMPITALGGVIGLGAPQGFEIDFWKKSNLHEELFGENAVSRGIGCSNNVNTQDEVYISVKQQLKRNYSITKEFEIKDVVFNLHIGYNLQKIGPYNISVLLKDFYFVKDEEADILTVYAFSFVISVDERNAYFYSDELGRMYDKESRELVDRFLYYNRDSFPEGSLPTE